MANASLSFRSAQSVHEREILRIAAIARAEDPADVMTRVRREVLLWAQRRSGSPLPREAWDGQAFYHPAGGRTTLCATIERQDLVLWALRGDDPDKNVPGRIWTHEITLGWRDENHLRIGVRQIVSTSESDFRVDPHVPGLMRQIADRCALEAGLFPISGQAWRIQSDGDVESLIEMLESPYRQLPVIVASGDERVGDPSAPLIDVDALAHATVGLAHIVALPARWTYMLSDVFGRNLSLFHGAIRTYYPGFEATSDPFDHHLSLGDAVRRDPSWTTADLRRNIAAFSLKRTRVGRDVITFAEIRSASLRLEQERRVSEGASDTDQIDILRQRLEALENEVVAAETQADQSFDLAATEEERARAAEAQMAAFRARIHALTQQLKSRGINPDDTLAFPETWDDFADWAAETFAGRCILTPTARRGVRKPLFDDPILAGQCLQWLATACRDRRQSGGGTLANIPILEGVENAPCGTDTFDFDFEGRKLQADWHVKSGGNTRDPSRCLRIYYTYDELTQQIIVAEMPAHRRTAAT